MSVYFGECFFSLCAGIVSDDLSTEKESKRARVEVSDDTEDEESVSWNIEIHKDETNTENDQSPDDRVEIKVEHTDNITSSISSVSEEKQDRQNDSVEEKEANEKVNETDISMSTELCEKTEITLNARSESESNLNESREESETEEKQDRHDDSVEEVKANKKFTETELSMTTELCEKTEITLNARNENEAYLNESREESVTEEAAAEESSSNIEQDQESQKVKDEFIYRLLRFDESYTDGLRPKDIYSSICLEKHVEEGSKNGYMYKSRYISCCKTMNALRRLGGECRKMSYAVREVVRINITKLDRNQVKVIDLTDYGTRKKHINESSRAWGYAYRFEEVILEPITHVPKECVEKIGKVHERSFIKDEHIKLD